MADSSTSLAPAAALGHPAAQSSLFPVTQAPTSGEISIQAEDGEASGAATSCLLWELTLRASHRTCPGQDATGGWDRALGTQRQRWGPVSHLTGCRFFLGVPIQQLPPLLLQNFPLPSDRVWGGVGETGREGRVARR